jgi:hypothetical protein
MDTTIDNTKTLAQQIQFQLQWLGVMNMAGREDEANAAFGRAQELVQKLIDEGY